MCMVRVFYLGIRYHLGLWLRVSEEKSFLNKFKFHPTAIGRLPAWKLNLWATSNSQLKMMNGELLKLMNLICLECLESYLSWHRDSKHQKIISERKDEIYGKARRWYATRVIEINVNWDWKCRKCDAISKNGFLKIELSGVVAVVALSSSANFNLAVSVSAFTSQAAHFTFDFKCRDVLLLAYFSFRKIFLPSL